MSLDPNTRPAEARAPGIQSGFPARRDRPAPNNLPLPLSSFVGRTEALATVQRLLTTTRLLTLTGPGGVGKSRLALEAAAAVLNRYDDGVWWVEVAPLCEDGLVAQEVASSLGVPEDAAYSREAALSEYLRNKQLLLVLNNCEHLVEACASLAEQLLSSCPRLHILTTGREPLDVAGEAVWLVPPLSVPCLEGTPTLETLTQSEAGQLFLDRARIIQPDLRVTEPVARAIAEVCCRLDGIPLAIELAATRVRVLSIPQIATHLDDRFRLLTGGSRTALPRHQTMQATVEWSYDLLTRPEQKLFERLAVFAGGFTLETAGTVASDLDGPEAIPPADVLDLLSRLVLKSLVLVRDGGQVRYHMLETIREYAWERLRTSGERERIRERHLAYFLEMATTAESKIVSEEQVKWLKLLQVEHENLRTALAWSQESKSRDAGLRLATALASFWLRVGYLSEGSGWLERALAACREVGLPRIRALYQAGRLAQQQGDYEQALAFAKQSLTLSRRLKDRQGMARALGLLGWVAHWQGKRNQAGRLLEEALALARECQDERTVARTLLFLSDLRMRQAAHSEAVSLLQESLALYQRMGDGWSIAWALGALGEVARLQGDYERAAAQLRLSLSFYQELESRSEFPYPLEALALTAADQGYLQRAARLWGAASAVRDATHALLPPSYAADYAPTLARLQAALGEDAFALAWGEGHAMTLEEALALAQAPAIPEPTVPPAPRAGREPPTHPQLRPHEHGLTPREVDVLRLVASGLTDAQIAERLVISPRTVGKHLQSVYSKLYLPSRSAATRWAIKHHLD